MMTYAAVHVVGVDEGLAMLRRAIDERDGTHISMVRPWGRMAILQADPRFNEIVRPLNLPN